MPVPPTARCAWILLGLGLLGGCENTNLGKPPPDDGLFFPGGMLLDPRGGAARDPETGGPARKRFLFVANGNNDLSYSGGTVVAIDLDEFYESWTADENTMAVDPYCPDPDGDDDIDRCVQNVGSRVSPERPCRRLALRPNVVECDESAFVKRTAYVGDFATLLRSSCEVPPEGGACDHTRLWLPVRGDPSITYVDLLPYTEGEDDDIGFRFDCRNDNDDEGPIDAWPPDADDRCGKSHKLKHLRSNSDLPEIDREPFTMIVSERDRLAYAAHSDSASLTVVGLDGLKDPTKSSGLTGVPTVVDSPDLFAEPNGLTGGFGLAERPCSLPDNAPTITNGCTRPLVYGGYRYRMLLASFTVQGIDDPEVECLLPEEDLDAPGKINCDPQLRAVQRFFAGGIDPNSQAPRPVLGDIAFGDERGDELFIVQTYPGAFLKLDTSLGPDGEPFDTQAAPPIELCDEPTRMKLWTDNGQRLAFVTCFRAALIYVIDLDAFRVLETIVGGTGPYELEVDSGREVLYVGNTLERSISVIDISRTRATRFREVARLGLQDPFSQ